MRLLEDRNKRQFKTPRGAPKFFHLLMEKRSTIKAIPEVSLVSLMLRKHTVL